MSQYKMQSDGINSQLSVRARYFAITVVVMAIPVVSAAMNTFLSHLRFSKFFDDNKDH